jgi:predicted transglutaminase-like cysteine proteinase
MSIWNWAHAKRSTLAAITVLSLVTQAANASAKDFVSWSDHKQMPLGQSVAAPTAFLELCARSPQDCAETPETRLQDIASEARAAILAKYDMAFSHANSISNGPEPVPGALIGTRKSDGKTQWTHFPPAGSTTQAAYASISLNSVSAKAIKAVNDKVNRMLIPDTDANIYKTNDYWEAPELKRGARGDCEDFALVKRRLLIAAGVPATSLSLAIVKTRYHEDHAVLVISTSEGEFVLDSLNSEIRPWQTTDYTWISRQAPGDDLKWVSLAVQPQSDLNVARLP